MFLYSITLPIFIVNGVFTARYVLNIHIRGVVCWLVPCRRPGFIPSSVHVKLWLDKLLLGQGFLIIPPVTNSMSSSTFRLGTVQNALLFRKAKGIG